MTAVTVKEEIRTHSQKEDHEDTGRRQPSKAKELGFPGGTVVKNPSANAGDTGSSPGPGRSHMPRSN